MPLGLPETVDLLPYARSAARVLVILAGAFILSHLVRAAIRKTQDRVTGIMEGHGDMAPEAIRKRTITIGGILRATSAVIIWTVAVIMCLNEAGFNVGPLLAGAGIAGVAIGFGAQSLVRDVISGVFMLLEDQIRVGDVVEINGIGGLVEEINLRTTVLRGANGAVHIFRNGDMQTVSNLTRDYSYYVFDIGVDYDEDTDRVLGAMRAVADELRREPEFEQIVLEPLEVFGVDRFEESAVIVKARIKTKPIKQWAVGRELNRRFKKRFDELGIEIPHPQLSLHMSPGSLSALTEGSQSGDEQSVE
jgi:small conductance mechanosensitive channel